MSNKEFYLVIYVVKSFTVFLLTISLFSLLLAFVATTHSVSDTYTYRVYLKIYMRFENKSASEVSVPDKLVLIINGTTEFTILKLSDDGVTLKLKPSFTLSGEVEPSSMQQKLQELLGLLSAWINRDYEVSVPLSVLGLSPYESLEDFLQESLGLDSSWLSISLNVTTARFTTWRGIPALLLESTGNVTSTRTQYLSIRTYVESRAYLDPTTFLTLYSEGKAACSLSYSGMTMSYLIEAKSELINVDVIRQVSLRAYSIKFDEGESRIYIASESLGVSNISTDKNEFIMRVNGSGLSGITIFTTQNVKIQKVVVDNTPVNYRVVKYGDENIVKIPLILSEHEIRIAYDETIKSTREIPTVETETNTTLLVLAMIVAPIVVLITLLVYLLKKKPH